jgi:homoserine kinase type II
MTELSAAELAELAETFGLGAIEGWARIEAGTVNSNYWIEAGGARVFVRVNEGKSSADINYEIALVDAIRGAGVATAAILATPGGERAVWRHGRPVMLFEWIDGAHREPGSITAADVAEVAGELAALHRATAGFDRRRPGIYRTADIAGRFAGFRGSSDPELAAAIALIGEELAFLEARAARREALERAVIHQDLFPDNVLFRPGARPALIDFEQAADGAALYDLAVLINAWCFATDELDDRRLAAAIAAYNSMGGIDRIDEAGEALWIELRAAAVRFAVTRITDVYLPGLSRGGKDFGEYTGRLERWRQIGAAGLIERARSSD